MFSLGIIPVLFIIALVYAGIGLGGGSAYLALLSFWNTDPSVIRPVVWTLNIITAGLSFRNYFKAGCFDSRLSYPFIISGVIGASLGARAEIPVYVFRVLLASCLFIVSLNMVFFQDNSKTNRKEPTSPSNLISVMTGLLVGILSGIVGFGGGIILGPLMLTFNWVDTKKIPALTSLYVCFSSAAALITYLFSHHGFSYRPLAFFGITVLTGAYIGSWYGAFKASPSLIKRVLGLVIMVASLRIWLTL